jgi:hypothetical protein
MSSIHWSRSLMLYEQQSAITLCEAPPTRTPPLPRAAERYHTARHPHGAASHGDHDALRRTPGPNRVHGRGRGRRDGLLCAGCIA